MEGRLHCISLLYTLTLCQCIVTHAYNTSGYSTVHLCHEGDAHTTQESSICLGQKVLLSNPQAMERRMIGWLLLKPVFLPTGKRFGMQPDVMYCGYLTHAERQNHKCYILICKNEQVYCPWFLKVYVVKSWLTISYRLLWQQGKDGRGVRRCSKEWSAKK